MCSYRLSSSPIDVSSPAGPRSSRARLRRRIGSTLLVALTVGLVGACGGRSDYIFSDDQGRGSGRGSGDDDGPGDGDVGFGTTVDGDGDLVGDGDGRYYVGDGDRDGYEYYDYCEESGDCYYGGRGYYGGPVEPGLPGYYRGGPGFPGYYGGGYEVPRPVVEEPLVDCKESGSSDISNGFGSCYEERDCSNGYVFASCWGEGERTFCECEGDNGWSSFEVTGVPENTCSVAVDYCSNVDVGSFGDPVCEPQWQDASPQYCSIEETCTSYSELPDGGQVGWSQWNSTWCDQYDGRWKCQCNAEGNDMSVSFEPSSVGITACQEADDICEKAGDLSGPVSCIQEFQSASANWCEVSMRCSQEAEVDGATVSINAWAGTNCQGDGDGEWSCSCNGMGVREQFRIMSSDPWDSCQEAGEHCLEKFEQAASNR